MEMSAKMSPSEPENNQPQRDIRETEGKNL